MPRRCPLRPPRRAPTATRSEGGLRKVARVVPPRPAGPHPRCCTCHEPDDPGRRLAVHAGRRPEGDETHEEAALRELAEETGSPGWSSARCSGPGRAPSRSRAAAGTRTSGTTSARTAATADGVPGATALTELERRSVSGARWWTCRELERAHETVYPTRLAELLRRLIDERAPGRAGDP
ncbi:NUDIX domain-containing protein [Streptomyces sp. L7]